MRAFFGHRRCACDPKRAVVCGAHQREHAAAVAALEPERIVAHFPLAEAKACADCRCVFSSRVYRACPSCTSASVQFVETLLREVAHASYEAATAIELERLHVVVPVV
jgi:hypothetical protein